MEITTPDGLWAWLEERHAQPESVLLVTWKASNRDRYVSRDEVLDALIAFGWVDGRRYKLDDERTMQLISPRQQQAFAQTYKERAERLVAESRMRPSGAAAVERSKRSGRWNESDEVDRLSVPDDLAAELDARGATDWWAQAAPSYRRNVLRWVAAAKRPPTRARRVTIVADHAARGTKVPNY